MKKTRPEPHVTKELESEPASKFTASYSSSSSGGSNNSNGEGTEVRAKPKQARPKFASLSLLLCSALGRRLDDLHFYVSPEKTVYLNKKALTELSYKKGHSWNCEIPIEVGSKKKSVIVNIFLIPDIAAADDSITTMQVSTVVNPSLLQKLKAGQEESWVVVETEVMDKYAGRRLDFMECAPHKIRDSGRVNFYQNVLSCDKVVHSESDTIAFILKVTFVTSPQRI